MKKPTPTSSAADWTDYMKKCVAETARLKAARDAAWESFNRADAAWLEGVRVQNDAQAQLNAALGIK